MTTTADTAAHALRPGARVTYRKPGSAFLFVGYAALTADGATVVDNLTIGARFALADIEIVSAR